MFRNFKRSFTPADVDDSIGGANYDQDHFADDVTGASWTLTNTSTTDSIAHRVSILNNSATDHSGKTVTLTGTDADGQTISDTVTLPAGSSIVESDLYFKTLVSPLVPSATIGADTMDIGIAAEIVSQTFPVGAYFGTVNVGTEVSGTIDYGVDHTFDDIQFTASSTWNWLNNAADNLTDSTTVNFGTIHPKAIRLRTNSYDTGALIDASIAAQSYN